MSLMVLVRRYTCLLTCKCSIRIFNLKVLVVIFWKTKTKETVRHPRHVAQNVHWSSIGFDKLIIVVNSMAEYLECRVFILFSYPVYG